MNPVGEFQGPVLNISNTPFTHYYYTFTTNHYDVNIYSTINYFKVNFSNRQWYSTYNFNLNLRTDEFENELEERVSFLTPVQLSQKSSITTFFTNHMIDIPRCLKKGYSIYKPIFNSPHLKLLHILMRHGCKEQIFATIFKLFVRSKLHLLKSCKVVDDSTHWLTLLPTLTTALIPALKEFQTFYYLKFKFKLLKKHINNAFLVHQEPLNMLTVLVTELKQYEPIFAFKTQKVDKMTRKHSRGKSGKYVILWKYVPVYRRIYSVLRWLIQDVGFQKTYKFETRFIQALSLLKSSPNRTMVYKCRNFNHNFVFKNFKKTLLQSLQTTS